MINKMAGKITGFIYCNSDLPQDIRDIYQYGIELIISSALNILLVVAASLIVCDFFAGVVFLLVFVFTRSFTGGYHAQTYFRCNLVMLLTFLSSFALHKAMIEIRPDIRIIEAVLLVNLFTVILFCPVQNIHKKLSPQKIKTNRILSIIVTLLLAVASVVLITSDICYGYLIVMTVSAISVMIIIEIILQRRGYHEI